MSTRSESASTHADGGTEEALSDGTEEVDGDGDGPALPADSGALASGPASLSHAARTCGEGVVLMGLGIHGVV